MTVELAMGSMTMIAAEYLGENISRQKGKEKETEREA